MDGPRCRPESLLDGVLRVFGRTADLQAEPIDAMAVRCDEPVQSGNVARSGGIQEELVGDSSHPLGSWSVRRRRRVRKFQRTLLGVAFLQGGMTTSFDSLILVYSGKGGLGAMLLDAVRKAARREDCALCEITYSPLGKRREWRACEERIGLPVVELHRNEVPKEWALRDDALPCVLGRQGDRAPVVLLRREEIASCRGSADVLERRIREALAAEGHGRVPPSGAGIETP
jgi:hypothetical protein